MCRTALDPRDQSPDQGQVTLRADLAAQPQPCLDHHGQCHPHNATLFLDTAFIGWHLSEVPWLFNQVLVHCLTLSPGADPPCGDGPLVEPKRCHNRLPGTPMGEQGHDDDHGFCRGAQPIADRPCGRAEGFVARVTDEPLLLPRMDPDIALARLASGRTVPIGAEDGCGVHDGPPPDSAGNIARMKYVWAPFSLQPHRPTIGCGSIRFITSCSKGEFRAA